MQGCDRICGAQAWRLRNAFRGFTASLASQAVHRVWGYVMGLHYLRYRCWQASPANTSDRSEFRISSHQKNNQRGISKTFDMSQNKVQEEASKLKGLVQKNVDADGLKATFSVSHFDVNAVIRGMQLTLVGGM